MGAFVVTTVGLGACSKDTNTTEGLVPGDDTGSIFDTSDGSGGCKAGLEACGATCADLSTDKANCGGCGITFSSPAPCCPGECVETAACAFSPTGLGPGGGRG